MILDMDLIFKEIDSIDVYTPSGNFLFTLDELQSSSIANTEESTDITGKNGRRISRKKRNKGVTVSGANGMVSSGLLALQTGGELVDKDGTGTNGYARVEWCDYLTVAVSDGTATAETKFKAVGTAGAEIIALYVKNEDNAIAEKFEQKTSATKYGEFTYDNSDKTITFGADSSPAKSVKAGTQIIVYYKRDLQATVLTNDSEKYSGQAMLYINGLAEDKCANVYRVQFFFPKVDFSGEFTLDFGGDQTVHNFEAIALAGACGAGSEYYTYTIFGKNQEDAPST